MKFNIFILFSFIIFLESYCFQNKTVENYLGHINQNKKIKDLFDSFYENKLQPAEFLLETQKIDYDLINLGLRNSKILSERMNNNRQINPPCLNCRFGVFCECDETLAVDNLSEDIPLIEPLVHKVMRKGITFDQNPCFLQNTCKCALNEFGCKCNCPCKCIYKTKDLQECPSHIVQKRICNCQCPRRIIPNLLIQN